MVGRVSFNVVTVLFVLVPGLIGMKAFFHAYVRLDNLSRFDKLAVIITVGSFALVVPPLVLNWNCWTNHVVDFLSSPHVPNSNRLTATDSWCSENVITFGNVMTSEQLARVPLVVLITFLGAHTVFVGTTTYAIGWILNKEGEGPPREPKDIEQPWEYASKKTVRESDRATVITTEGEEIRGIIHRIGSPSEDYDILLQDSEKVIRDSQTDSEVDTRNLAAYTYHHYRDISRIRFPDLDVDDDFEIDLSDATERFEEKMEQSTNTDDDTGRESNASSEENG